MYIEYKIIDGVLSVRYGPSNAFVPLTPKQLTDYIEALRRDWESLAQNGELWQVIETTHEGGTFSWPQKRVVFSTFSKSKAEKYISGSEADGLKIEGPYKFNDWDFT